MITPPPTEQRVVDFQVHMDWVNHRHHWREGRHRFPDGWKPGRYNDHRRMAIDAVMSQEKYGAIALYYGANVLKDTAIVGPEEPNKLLRRAAKGTGATRNQIDYQGCYAIDVDSYHPDKVMATDAERNAAMELAAEVLELIRTTVPGFPEPAIVSTGNGIQMIWAYDERGGVESKSWSYVIRHLAGRYSADPRGEDRHVHHRRHTTAANPRRNQS